MQYFFEEATGLELSSASYNSSSISSTSEYLVIGVQPAKNKGLSFDGITTGTGYKLTSNFHNLYVYGNTPEGVINGVYGLLEELFNLEFFTNDVYNIDTNVTTLSKTAISETHNDYFSYNFSSYGEVRDDIGDQEYKNRLGFVQDYTVMGWGVHNMLSLVPYETYGAAHPGWFESVTSDDGYTTGYQLVLSYNNFEMVSTVASIFKNSLVSSNFSHNIVGFSPMDINAWPTSASSSAAYYTQYGCYSAEYIIFMNQLVQSLDTWLATNYPTQELTVYLLAYNKTLTAPATYNSTTQQYEAMDSNVVFYSGNNAKLGVYIAPVEVNYYLAFNNANNLTNDSETVETVLKKWSALTDEIYLWQYSLDCDNYYMMLNTIDNMATNYRIAYENGVKIMFNQAQYNNAVATDWSRLKIYLQSEMAENPYQDLSVLISNFMSAYFVDSNAVIYMNTLLTEMRSYAATLYSKNSHYGELRGSAFTINSSCDSYWDDEPSGLITKTYNSSMLLRWMGYINSAKSSISGLQSTNLALYNTLIDRINLESLTIRYMLVNIYDDTTYDASIDAVNSAASALGMTVFSE